MSDATPTIRLQRSRLFVPCVRPELFAKAAGGPADCLCLDLEDSVAPAEKDKARDNLVAGLKETDFGDKFVTVRINDVTTPWAYRDILALIENACDRVDAVLVPKVNGPFDLQAVAWLFASARARFSFAKRFGLEAIIETAEGLANVEAIARAVPELESLHFGAADFAASTGMRTTGIGVAEEDYAIDTDAGRTPGDVWHYPLMRIVTAARAAGITPIDGPYGDFGDDAGFRAQSRRAALMGFEGKWAIHPKQVALANDVFTPPDAQVETARGILDAMAEAQAQGLGAVTYRGQLIDNASIKQAKVVVAKMDRITSR